MLPVSMAYASPEGEPTELGKLTQERSRFLNRAAGKRTAVERVADRAAQQVEVAVCEDATFSSFEVLQKRWREEALQRLLVACCAAVGQHQLALPAL